jgi:hypothetical protein
MGCIAAKYMDQILFWWKLYHSKFTLLLFSCVSPYFTFKNDDVHGLSTHTQTHTHTNEEACHKIYIYIYIWRGREKKSKNQLNRENQETNNWKNWTVKKDRLKFWKNWPVWFGFGFISPKIKKSNRTQTRKNRAKAVWTGFCSKNRTGPNRNRSVWTGFGFFKKKLV